MIERSEITLPTAWASALINGDYTSLTRLEVDRCSVIEDNLLREGWSIVSDVEDSDRLTGRYDLYDPDSGFLGGNVTDYVILCAVPDIIL